MDWAIIGASTIAEQYMIGAIRTQPDCDVRWIVSATAKRAAQLAQAQGVAHSGSDLGLALADPAVKAVYVSSTNDRHHVQALAAIDAGKHVLCEQPLALTVGQAAQIVRAAEQAGLILATNHHLRSASSIRTIRDLVAAGRVGRVLSLRVFHAVQVPAHLHGWRLDNPAAGGGVIADLTVHNADLVRFLLAEDPVSVVAQMGESGLGQGVEDSAMSVWTMPSGAMVFSHESFTHAFASSGVEVHGTDGSILARGVLAQDPVGEIDLVTAQGTTRIPFARDPIYSAVLRDFVGAVAQGRSPAASGRDGLKSLQIAQAVRHAAKSGQCQHVNYGEGL